MRRTQRGVRYLADPNRNATWGLVSCDRCSHASFCNQYRLQLAGPEVPSSDGRPNHFGRRERVSALVATAHYLSRRLQTERVAFLPGLASCRRRGFRGFYDGGPSAMRRAGGLGGPGQRRPSASWRRRPGGLLVAAAAGGRPAQRASCPTSRGGRRVTPVRMAAAAAAGGPLSPRLTS